MVILGIETSSAHASVAITSKGKCLAQKVYSRSLGHSEKLLPACDALFKKSGIKAEDLDAIAVGTGPGSYTGLRVGLAGAKGLGFLNKIKVIGVPSIDALAEAVQSKSNGEPKPFYVVIDAKRKEHYIASYKKRGDGRKRHGKIQLISDSELQKLLKKGAVVYGPEMSGEYPQASCVSLLGEKLLKEKKKIKEPEPIYLRPFIAKKSEEHKSSCFTVAGQKSI